MATDKSSIIPMTLLDRSLYFKGMLILIKQDHLITKDEKETLIHIGRILDFETEYCTETIQNLLDNQHITDEAVLFSGKNIAKIFLKDGIRVAFCDKRLHKKEIAWLHKTAEANGISFTWVDREVKAYLHNQSAQIEQPLLIESLWAKESNNHAPLPFNIKKSA